MKASKNYKIGGTVVVPPIDPPSNQDFPGIVNITVNFNSSPTATVDFPKLKYNKSKAILMEFDDNSLSVVTAYDKLKTTFYTDGCGNNKNFSVGLAVNAKNNFNNAEWGDNYPNKTTYAQRGALIPFGLDIMNHSYYHEPTGNYNNGVDITRNLRDLDAFILEKDKYKMNSLVVPTNYAGYQLAARDFGYLFGSSEGTFDGLTPYPGQYNALGNVNNIPKQSYTAIKRTFSDNWTNAGPQWAAIDTLFSSAADYFEIGSHGTGDGVNFINWVNSIVSRSNDTTLFQSMREFMEYRHLKENVVKTQTTTGNSLKISLDYSGVPNKNLSWFDLSLLINSNQTISSISIDDPSFSLSYNTTTKLINIFKRKTQWL